MDLMTLVTEPGSHTQHPIKGATRLLLIEHSQQLQILHALVYRLVVQACAVHPEPRALPPHAELSVVRFNPLPPTVKRAIQLFF
jgi:hypothetical protein